MSELIGKDEVCRVLGITRRHLEELIYRREIAIVKVGHLVRFRPEDLAGFIDENYRPADAAP